VIDLHPTSEDDQLLDIADESDIAENQPYYFAPAKLYYSVSVWMFAFLVLGIAILLADRLFHFTNAWGIVQMLLFGIALILMPVGFLFVYFSFQQVAASSWMAVYGDKDYGTHDSGSVSGESVQVENDFKWGETLT